MGKMGNFLPFTNTWNMYHSSNLCCVSGVHLASCYEIHQFLFGIDQYFLCLCVATKTGRDNELKKHERTQPPGLSVAKILMFRESQKRGDSSAASAAVFS